MAKQSPFIDFQEVKQKVSIPDALEVMKLIGFNEKNGVFSGVCPMPTHKHGPSPNPLQFKFDNKRGTWLWHCFGNCDTGGDVIDLVRGVVNLSIEDVRLWFADKFGDRLTIEQTWFRSAYAGGMVEEVMLRVGDAEDTTFGFHKAHCVYDDPSAPSHRGAWAGLTQLAADEGFTSFAAFVAALPAEVAVSLIAIQRKWEASAANTSCRVLLPGE